MKQRTRDILLAAGWSSDRVRSTSSAEQALEEAGYSVWPDLVEFLRAHIGLRVPIIRNGRSDAFWFDPSRAMARTWPSWVIEYGRRAEQVVVPVGYAHHDHLLLLMGEDGTWYGGYDDAFGILGRNVDEMLDGLVAGSGFLDI